MTAAPRSSAVSGPTERPRIGVLGGSFDPPHIGHVLLAQDALETLALTHLVVVPAAIQPLKGVQPTPAAARLAMTRAAFEGMPRTSVDPIEIERGGLSFMVDTVEALARRWPDAELLLLLGADAAAGLARWREPDRLLRCARLVVAVRADASAAEQAEPWRDWPGILPPRRLASRRVDVSSTEIRARVASGRSIHGFVPEAVAAYIATSGLYLSRNAC